MVILASLLPSEMLKILMVLDTFAYILLVFDIIVVMYNRRKVVEESKCPIIVLIINVYTANTLLLSLWVWFLQQCQAKSFKGISTYFDSLYYTINIFYRRIICIDEG